MSIWCSARHTFPQVNFPGHVGDIFNWSTPNELMSHSHIFHTGIIEHVFCYEGYLSSEHMFMEEFLHVNMITLSLCL